MRIREVEHEGLAAVELIGAGARLVVVHESGPRIAWLSRPRGDNLLFWDTAGAHRRGDWSLRGGHRLWVTRPLADETEETYAADDRPCRVRRLADGISVTAPPDAFALEKTMTVRIRGTQIQVEHRLRNASDMLWSGGIWALTCTRPRRDTTYRVPWGEPTGWDTVAIVIPRRWGGGHGSRVDDPQIVLTEDALIVRPRRLEAKRMIRARPGRVEMVDGDRAHFIKQARFLPDRSYPLDTNLALYVGPERFMVEMETMSPVEVVPPGDTMVHVETWTIR